jgi:RecA-family ATPase
MTELEAELGQWDDVALVNRLQADAAWGRDGFDAGYVAEVTHSAGNPAIWKYHVDQILAAWRQRLVRQEAEKLLQLSANGFDADALQSTIGKISQVVSDAGESEQSPCSVRNLMLAHPHQRKPVVNGLLRFGETMNIIAVPKRGKTWFNYGLALSVATGCRWLDTFDCTRGRVLIIDGELYPEVSGSLA